MENSTLRKKLEPYGLDTATALAKAMRRDISRTSRWLNGEPFSVGTAQHIARIINALAKKDTALEGVEWSVVYGWQKGATSPDANRYKT